MTEKKRETETDKKRANEGAKRKGEKKENLGEIEGEKREKKKVL